MKKSAILIVALVSVMTILGIISYRLIRSLLGYTVLGNVSNITEVPRFGKQLDVFQTKGSVAYHIYQQWGRHIAFVSGATSLSCVSNFVAQNSMEFAPQSDKDTDLVHLAFTCQVNTQQVGTTFAGTDALASAQNSTLGKHVLLRYRYSDGVFTLLFFN
jgi:hypothetical protein